MKVQQGQYRRLPYRTSQPGPEVGAMLHCHQKEKAVAIPDYLICLNCEAPSYIFEWKDDEVVEAYCELCTSEEVDQFLTQEDFDALIEA
jgi:hypothetical protein